MTYTKAQQAAFNRTADRYNDLFKRLAVRHFERHTPNAQRCRENDRLSQRGWREMDRVRRTVR